MRISHTSQRQRCQITFRSIALGLILIPLNALWVVWQERVMFGPYPSTISIFANVVFAVFLLQCLNWPLRRFLPRFALVQGELITLYTMLAISTGLAGLDAYSALGEMLPFEARFHKQYSSTMMNAFPSWLTVHGSKVIKGFFVGHSTFYSLPVLRAWLPPMLAWTCFISLLLGVCACISVLVRAQWADNEHLSFPITWLPLEMTDSGGQSGFYKSRIMWAGFTTAALISLWNGIAFLKPAMPSIPVGITDLTPMLTAKPLNAIDWLPMTFYPIAIGICFLLPLDLLFSCWFFYFFWKGQMVVSRAFGWDSAPQFPYIREQGFGALMGLFVFYIWSGRKAYADILRAAWNSLRGRPSAGGSGNEEAIPYRYALAGIIAGVLLMIAFLQKAGVTLWIAVLFVAVVVATLIVVTRVRAELGSPVHDFHFMGPDNMFPHLLPPQSLAASDLAFLTFSYSFTRAHRSDTMPVALEGLQMAHMRQMEARRMFAAIMLATVLGAFCAIWAFVHFAYQMGATAQMSSGVGMAQEAFTRMNGVLQGSVGHGSQAPERIAAGVGLLCSLGLAALRLQFIDFPFHPLGYALASSWAINLVWMPMLIAWLLKGFLTRYGGLKMYRQAVPFFLGLILGDCVMGAFWALMSIVLHTRTYNFFGA